MPLLLCIGGYEQKEKTTMVPSFDEMRTKCLNLYVCDLEICGWLGEEEKRGTV